MLNFSNNPTEFLNRFIASCIQDSKVKNGKNLIHNFNLKKKTLQITTATAKQSEEAERKAAFYYQPYIRDAVNQYLEKEV